MALIRGTPNERVVWPWPVRSSARTTSPGPKRRVVPSPIPISICPMRIKCIVAGARCASRSNSPQGNSGTRGWHPPEVQCCGSPRPAEGDLQNGSGRRGPYISVRSARAPSHREIIVHAKACFASSPTAKPLAFLLSTLPPECQDFCMPVGRSRPFSGRSLVLAKGRPVPLSGRSCC